MRGIAVRLLRQKMGAPGTSAPKRIPLDSYNKRRLGAAEVAKPGNVALLMKQTLLPRFYGSCGLERPAGGGGHGALQAGGAQRPASSSKPADRSMQAAPSERIGGVEER